MTDRENEEPKSLQRLVSYRLEVVGIPKVYSNQFSDLIQRWAVNSGEEWTIKRCKSLKVDLIRVRAGLLPLSTWVKKKGNSFAGVIGSLFRYADKSDKNFNQVLQTFMVYTLFQFKTASPAQLKKFSDAVQSRPIPIDPDFSSNFCWMAQKFTGRVKIDRPLWGNSLLLYRGSPSKTCPTMEWEPRRHQDFDVLRNFEWFQGDNDHAEFFSFYRKLYEPVLKGLEPMRHLPHVYSSSPPPPDFVSGGRIGLIQEPGGKLRSVANPHIVHQLALKPFGKALYKLARSLPWDCTHDQSLPNHTLQDHLSKRKMIHSVDLSSATDLFPLEIQISLMKSLFGHQQDIDLTESLSRSSWTFQGSKIRWTKGQPLGLYPSFGMFTVTHGFLLWYLNGCTHNDQFFVVGDDVVILNDQLFRKYINILNEWKVPWSPDKSLSSDVLCEFAGKVITSKYVLSQMKWRQISDNNFKDICSLLGPRSRDLLRPRQKVVFDQIANLVKPFGLGFNSKGETLASRIERTDALLSEEKLSSSLMGLHGLISKNLYGSGSYKMSITPLEIEDVLDLLETFDKKVRGVLQSILSSFDSTAVRIPPSSLQGFSTLPEVLSSSDLPRLHVEPSLVSQLDHYEQILHLKR